jgi:putative transposase
MKLVEKHIISNNSDFYKEIDKICFLSKNLYNRANYIIRQEFIKNKKWIRYNDLQKQLQNSKDVDYEALPRKVSQQVLMQLDRNWKSFFKSIKEWKANPDKFKGRPKLPRYKHKTAGRNILIYTIQAISKPELEEFILHLSGTDIKIKILHNKINQARIIPLKNKKYKIEVVYEQRRKNRKLNKNLVAGIDIGVDNLGAVTSNHNKWTPLLINGRPLKSINQYFNKRKAELMSELMKEDENRRTSNQIERLTFKRNMKIDDYLHKASRFIINRLSDYGIGTLIIGKNKNWKQEVNMGAQSNQNFVSIPFARFIEMLQYKGDLIGMKVIAKEENHTSKCSFLDNEEIRHKEKYAGRRIKRGLFRSNKKILINADCNGSGNIIRKVIPNAFADGIEGVVVRPVRFTIPISGKPEVKSQNAYKLVA